MNDLVGFLVNFIFGASIIFCCYLSLKIILSNPFFRSPFGYICASQSLAESGWAMCFTFYGAPMCLWDSKNGSIDISSVIVGQILMFFNFFTLFMLLLKSMNRFHAIIFPIHYRTKVTINMAKFAIVFIIAFSFLCLIPFLFPSCNIYFNNELYFWTQRESTCVITNYIHGTLLMGVVITTLICDGITLFYSIIFKNKLQQISTINYAKEKKFFFQTCIATIFHIITFLFTYVFAKYATTPNIQFLFTTPPWLMFTLSNELTFVLFSYHTIKKSSSVMVSKATVVAKNAKTRSTING